LQQTYAEPVSGRPPVSCVSVVVRRIRPRSLDPLRVTASDRAVPKALAQDMEKVHSRRARLSGDFVLSLRAQARLCLTLTLTLLLALTCALGLAVVLFGERVAAPLGLLAEGTRAVAPGGLLASSTGHLARRELQAY
jgi:nitrogen fixation/metabolism regulation signal transduction histidine kinase